MSTEHAEMRCARCGAVWLSVAAQSLIYGRAGCLRCDAPLQTFDGRSSEQEDFDPAATVVTFHEAFDRRDVEALRSLLHPEVEFHTITPVASDCVPMKARDAVVGLMRLLYSRWDD